MTGASTSSGASSLRVRDMMTSRIVQCRHHEGVTFRRHNVTPPAAGTHNRLPHTSSTWPEVYTRKCRAGLRVLGKRREHPPGRKESAVRGQEFVEEGVDTEPAHRPRPVRLGGEQGPRL